MGKKKYLIVIGGPTGVGKSKIAIHLAQHFNCDVISADSRQLYKEMLIGTARLTAEEMDGVQHHFLGTRSIADFYDVGIYEQNVLSFLNEYFRNNEYCILCGGSGLYIRAVCEGLDQFPEIDRKVIDLVEEDLKNKGIEFLQNELKNKDNEYYDLVDLENSRRLVRAISVIRTSGKKFSSFLNQKSEERAFNSIYINLTMDRNDLYQKINQRVDQMIDSGLLDEARQLYPKRNLKALQTVGYSELFRHLSGEIELEFAIEEIKKNTRRYAKRQMTWFKNQGSWNSFHADNPVEIIKHIKLINI